MSFTSYAQNGEDVILYGALKQIDGGFYIDIGAYHPIIDSVTKAFYDRGWHGINVEPNPDCFNLLKVDRVRDTNLNIAVGNFVGEVTFYNVVDTGLSTIRSEYAEHAALAGFEVQELNIPCSTLDVICSIYDVQTVHFLKIDAEGAERDILQGFSFDRVRPWVLVIEACEPGTMNNTYDEWEQLVITKEYEFVYCDGLNRFYIASERTELRGCFRPPFNSEERSE